MGMMLIYCHLFVFAVCYTSLEDPLNDGLKSRIYLAFARTFFCLEFDVSVDRLGCTYLKQRYTEIELIIRTDNSFDIFFRSRSATFCFKRVSCTEGERKSLVVLSQEIVHFARQKSSGSLRIFL